MSFAGIAFSAERRTLAIAVHWLPAAKHVPSLWPGAGRGLAGDWLGASARVRVFNLNLHTEEREKEGRGEMETGVGEWKE